MVINRDSAYYQQVSLLIKMLPIVSGESVFALKGGTAINLFVRNFPRLSVDIDLAYLPLESRDEALVNVQSALRRIAQRINSQPGIKGVLQDHREDELRIIVSNSLATIKIEVSPVAGGTLHPPVLMEVQSSVEEEFGYAEMPVVSLPDLYGGKLCAAMDRQHPRDLFDVLLLLEEDGISREIFIGFLTYVLGHPRPINEVISPNWQPLNDKFQLEFSGMTNKPVTLDNLLCVRQSMVAALQAQMTQRDHEFLLSFKQGKPDWSLFDYPLAAAQLPAVKWKLLNIKQLAKNPIKHEQQLTKLDNVLEQWFKFN